MCCRIVPEGCGEEEDVVFGADFHPECPEALEGELWGYLQIGPQLRGKRRAEEYRKRGHDAQRRSSLECFLPLPLLACSPELSSMVEVTRGSQLYLGASAGVLIAPQHSSITIFNFLEDINHKALGNFCGSCNL